MTSIESVHPPSSESFRDEKYDPESETQSFDENRIAEVTGAFFDDLNLDKNHMQLEDDSPYPEVRSAVANTDDPEMPVNTIRAWIIGFLWAILIPGLNQFFSFRFPSVTVGNLVAQLLSFPLGRAWARVVPDWKIFGVSLNPGPFSVKEHVLITVMAGTGSGHASEIVAVQRVFYNQIYNFSYQWFLVMSTQMIGFSIGGIARRFLVAPPSMIWPANLVFCALFNTLHSQDYAGMGTRGGISRERFFTYVFIGGMLWCFLFRALSVFSWVCWIAPNNATVNQLFGYQSGLGMSILTFDWAQITYTGSPLVTPWWTEANVMLGFVVFFWMIVPAWYYTNTMFQAHLPMLSAVSFDNMGKKYNVTAIINDDLTLNIEKYEAYSPLFLSSAFALGYGLSFACITATLVHAILYFRKQIWVQARRSVSEQPDIHARLMSRYKQVPDWWYVVVFLSMFVLGIISIEVWPTKFPVWAFCLALSISFVYVIPIGMIQAITNQQIALNVITELIIGYALPGKPIAMMMFKIWGYITMTQALQFTSDFKLGGQYNLCAGGMALMIVSGHYMKIPPRTMFWCQVLATIIAGTVQLGVQAWMFTNIDNFCSLDQKDGFTCPHTQVFGTASVVWGVIGPARQFSKGQLYYPLTFFFLGGILAPFVPYLITRKYPNSIFKYLNFPVILNGTGLIPPATAVNYVPWAIVGFIFQYVIRRRHFSWWIKYNYVLSAALDSGLAIGIIIVFFCLQFPKNGTIGAINVATWWGNTVFANTADARKVPHIQNPRGVPFGPTKW
ncbi:small oligopeptide transporter [Hysterangium stoloniferum]|nr:small oligopeptide transporter [Hysterangium stoloniferum]